MSPGQELIYIEVKGISMRPFFKTGDKFVIKKCSPKDLNIGGVIAYCSGQNNDIVCHRLVRRIKKKADYLLYTRQDSLDSWQTEEVGDKGLFGRVIAVVKNDRLISLDTWYQHFFNQILIIILPLAQKIYSSIWPLFKNE